MTRPHPIPEDRIRERAYRLWLEEGQPQGRSTEHWEKARELLALETDPEEGKAGVGEDPGPPGEQLEEASFLENQGEFPTTTDQGEQKIPKKRRPSVARKPAKRRAM